MSHDVFVSYSSKDKPMADAACAALESRGIRCWIAPRDIRPGMDWTDAIIDAIAGCRLMVVIVSKHSNLSEQVKRELTTAVGAGKTLIPLRIEDVTLSKHMQYFLGTPHWLDALTPPLEPHLKVLATTVQQFLAVARPVSAPVASGTGTAQRPAPKAATTPPRIGRGTSSGVPDAIKPTSGRLRRAVLLALPLLLAILMAVVMIPQYLPSLVLPLLNPGSPPAEPPKEITNSIGMKLVLIPAGEFLMGSDKADDPDAFDNEQPRHRVRITRPFYLGVTEVTQGQYRAVTGQSPSHFKGSDDLPVESVSWNDAVAFCDKLNELERGSLGGAIYRLPTEAEWEYACRGGTTTRYSFVDNVANLGDFAWYDGNSGETTHPVGQKRPNAFNLLDMHGNVLEWCQDGYKNVYYQESPAADPPGPFGLSGRVIRGGSGLSILHAARSAFRDRYTPGLRSHFLGFRLVRAQVQSGSR
jgi:formylglycine-generating enzyme required for sulfatase activity